MDAPRPFALRAFVAKLRGLVLGQRDGDDFDDEVREHLRLLADRFETQGMSKDDAAAAARRQFGNTVLVREDRRALQTLPSIEALWRDLRDGARFLRRNIAFTVVCVTLLALGIGLSVTIFAIVNGALLHPWPYRGYDRLVTVRGNYPQQARTDFSLWSPREVEDLTRDARSLAYVIAGDARDVNLIYQGRPERVRAAVITPNAFAMLGVAPLRGRLLIDQDALPGAQPAVLVSYDFWQQRLGASDAIVGHTLRIGDVPHTVVGVMPESFVFWDRELWMPLALDRSLGRADRRFYIQAQLAEGATTGEAEAELAAIARQWRSAYPEVAEYQGLTFGIDLLVEDVLRDLRPTLYLLLGAVVLVLVVATTNLANAMLAKGLARDSELAVRRAIGASATTLARQLLVESFILSAAGALIGTTAAMYALPFVVALVPYGYIPAEAAVGIDRTVLAGAIAVAAGCGLLMGVVPAVRAALVDPASTLKSASTRTGSRKTSYLRLVFVGAQLTIAVVVLGLSGAAVVGLQSVVHRHPGFDVADVWTTRMALSEGAAAGDRALTYRRLLDNLESAIGSPATVALASALPVGDLPRALVSREAASNIPGLAQKDTKVLAVSRAFFDVLDLRLLEGRLFAETDRETSPRVAIVTRSLAHDLWADGQAVGSRLYVHTGTTSEAFVVIGVTRDIVAQAGSVGAAPVLLLNLNQRPPATAVVMVKRGGENVMAAVSAAAARVDPQMPLYSPQMLEQARVATMGPLLLAATILAVFGVSVLVVSALGIYAVIDHSITDRANETRLRLVFGARVRQLVTVELLRAMRLVAVSVVIGAIAGAASLHWLASWNGAFAFDPISSLAFAAAAVTLLAFVATLVPTLRITRTAAAARLT